MKFFLDTANVEEIKRIHALKDWNSYSQTLVNAGETFATARL